MLSHIARSPAPIARHSADAARITRTVSAWPPPCPPPPSPPPAFSAAARRACTNAIQGVSGGRGASEPRAGRRAGRAGTRRREGVGGGVEAGAVVVAVGGREREEEGSVCERGVPSVAPSSEEGGGSVPTAGRQGGSAENAIAPRHPLSRHRPPPPFPPQANGTHRCHPQGWLHAQLGRQPPVHPAPPHRSLFTLSPSHATGSRAPLTVTRASSSTRATGAGRAQP